MDLNLFNVFDAIMTQRSIAGAGRELGVTASAVSHALSRLRKLLRDELFILGTEGMVPTAMAAELAPRIKDGLGSIRSSLASRAFDPAKMGRTFKVAATDLPTSVIMPVLLGRMLSRAPHASVRVLPVCGSEIIRQLDDGRLDIAMGCFGSLPDRLGRRTLLQDRDVVVVRAGHPLARQPITTVECSAFPYFVIECPPGPGGDHAYGQTKQGILRRILLDRSCFKRGGPDERVTGAVSATLPNFAGIAHVIGSTDAVAIVPERLARRAAQSGELVILDLPYAPLSIAVEVVWHERSAIDPGLCWLLEQATEAGAEAGNSTSDR